jgi:methionyl-tRNA synthetase
VVPDGGDAEGPLPTDDVDAEFVKEINELFKTYSTYMDAVKLRAGLQTVMQISARGNLYLQQSGLGNALLAENPKRCAQVISRAVNLIYALSAAIFPFMPSTSTSILAQLNAPARTVASVLGNDILAGHAIGEPEHLFKKIDEKQADVWKARFGTSEQTAPASEQPQATEAGKPISKKAAEKARKEAEKALAAARAKELADKGPKSSAALEAEEKVKKQGDEVRKLKADKASPEAVKEAVELLNKLKLELKNVE